MDPAPDQHGTPASRPRPANAVDLGRGAWIDPASLRFSFSRSGGPGGQHVNTTSTKATLRVALTDLGGLDHAGRERLESLASAWLAGSGELVIQADESRSQLDNREACVRRLRAVVTQAATPPKKRRKTRPSKGSKERRLESKRRTGEKKRSRGGGNSHDHG